MGKIKYTVLLVALCAGMTSLAHATLSAPTLLTVSDAGNATELSTFQNWSGDTDATIGNRLDTSNPYPGAPVTQGGFTYTFGRLSSKQYTVTVSFNLTGTGEIVCGFAVKNGTLHENFYTVTADEGVTNTFTLLVPSNGHQFGQLSSVIVFLCPGGTVPDGGTTVMLLGAALCGLGLVRRFLKR